MGKSRQQRLAAQRRLRRYQTSGPSHVIGLSERGKKLRAQIAERRAKKEKQ